MARLSHVGRIVDASELIAGLILLAVSRPSSPSGAAMPTVGIILLRTDSARIVSSKDAGALDDLAKAGAGNKAVDMTCKRS